MEEAEDVGDHQVEVAMVEGLAEEAVLEVREVVLDGAEVEGREDVVEEGEEIVARIAPCLPIHLSKKLMTRRIYWTKQRLKPTESRKCSRVRIRLKLLFQTL